ncbi:flavoprotein [Streptomyces sp. NPDC057545]|uniref:flavoprotein n=1 Tax=unclassified Streptomyces TaxID=2593676 RepID=UPI003692E802
MTSTHGKPRLVVGISGSSAPQLGIAMLRALAEAGTVETHLVISHGARRCIQLETGLSVGDVAAFADVVHNPADLAASISSGSFRTMGMAVVPCSARTLAAVATGNSDNLLTRAAAQASTTRLSNRICRPDRTRPWAPAAPTCCSTAHGPWISRRRTFHCAATSQPVTRTTSSDGSRIASPGGTCPRSPPREVEREKGHGLPEPTSMPPATFLRAC